MLNEVNVNNDYENAVDNIVRFESMLRVNFSNLDINKEFNIQKEKFGVFNFDILKWKRDKYNKNFHNYINRKEITYRFYLPEDQVEALNNNINQFKNVNLNFTLRKMSEYMRISDLFYHVESEEEKYKTEMEDFEFHTSTFAQ